MKRKDQLTAAAAEKAALELKLKDFDGIDPAAIRQMLADKKAAEDKQLAASGDFDRLRTRMAEEHGTTVKALQAALDEANGKVGKLSGTINELSIGSQFSQSKYISEELTLTPSKARLIYSDHFDLEDGNVVGYDKPRGAAKRTALVDQYGSPVGFEDAMRKIIASDPEKDQLTKSKIKPGAGSDSKKGAPAAKPDPLANGVSKISAGLAGIVKG